jgi:gamma-glutamyltranspeptidase/glutathione hydrolase
MIHHPRRIHFLATSLLAFALAAPAHAVSPPAVEAKQGMVVSSQYLATDIGVDILKQGGNAIDAAVAVGYAQAVVNACCGNIGGGGFMTIHLANGKDTFINFREKAPAAASADMYLDANGKIKPGASLHGYLAVGVPGTVAGFDHAQKKYGKLTRAQVLAPAIKLAREGYILNRADTDIIDTTVAWFKRDPESARIFLRRDGTPLQPGDRLVQKDLANTLEAIAKHGPDAFYKGAIPAAVEKAARANGGIITAADFAAYHVSETAPLSCSYRGYQFVSAPPPSSGGVTMCQILNILEGYDMKGLGYHSAASVHYMVEAMRHAYMDRNTFLGDPDFVKNPTERLLSKDYAAAIRQQILPDKATPSSAVLPGTMPHEKPETTHYSVVDKEGNAVSTTYTVNGRFGAVVIAPGTGFFLNDEMDDFTSKIGERNMYGLVQGASNAIVPGKRPLSSMAPTVVTRDGKTFMVVGSPGGSRIITITLQAVLNVIDHGMAPQEAVDAPHIHHQWQPDLVNYEPRTLSPDTLKILAGMGYTMKEQTPWGATEMILMGLPGAVGVAPASSGNDSGVSGKVLPGFIYGANDNRRPAGSAAGY